MRYAELAKLIRTVHGHKLIGFTAGEKAKKQFPFYVIKRGAGKKVLLTGAVHGDEPAGAFAIVTFFRAHAEEYEKEFEFTAFPCVNPWGLENCVRRNLLGQNLNREFRKDSNLKEVRLVKKRLEKYLFTMDMHETFDEPDKIMDNEPEGKDPVDFYLWETCEDKNLRVGMEIVNNVEKAGITVCKWPIVYGDKNNGGAIFYPEDCGTECYRGEESGTVEAYLSAHHTNHAFTIETFRDWPMEKRIRAHIISLRTALDKYRDKK